MQAKVYALYFFSIVENFIENRTPIDFGVAPFVFLRTFAIFGGNPVREKHMGTGNRIMPTR